MARTMAGAFFSMAAIAATCAAADGGTLDRVERIAEAGTNRAAVAAAKSAAASSVRVSMPMLPRAVRERVRLIGMDAETLPGYCIYAYAQGARTWCETNALKAVTFKAARNRYSKLKIVVAAKAAGKWDALKAGIAAAGLEDEWAACQYIEDGDPAFVSATNAVVAAGIATADEIAAFLKSAIDN